jgi:VIT1/CCC1 family predicted Fe2+/Mn2+ transporter
MLNPRTFSFGGTSGVVTSIGLIIGLGAATAPRSAIISGLLIVALADNLSDSLSIHMYQEAEKLEERAALRTTLVNFVVRLFFAFTFVLIVALLPDSYAAIVALVWGFLLLGLLSYVLARVRGVSSLSEVSKHFGVAVVVIAVSRVVGLWILHHFHEIAP